jgi:hypothetical protein
MSSRKNSSSDVVLADAVDELLWMRVWAECACYCGDEKRNMSRKEGDGGK